MRRGVRTSKSTIPLKIALDLSKLLFLELARYHMWRLSQTWNGCFRIQVHRETDGGLADCSVQAAQVEPHPSTVGGPPEMTH